MALVSFTSEYMNDITTYWVVVLSMFIIFNVFAFIWFGIKTMLYLKMHPLSLTYDNKIPHLVSKTIYNFLDCWTTVNFWLLFFFYFYWYFFFKI